MQIQSTSIDLSIRLEPRKKLSVPEVRLIDKEIFSILDNSFEDEIPPKEKK